MVLAMDSPMPMDELTKRLAVLPDNTAVLFGGASVVPYNIVNNLAKFSDVRAGRFQNGLCGFGIGQNSAERLVHFMSN